MKSIAPSLLALAALCSSSHAVVLNGLSIIGSSPAFSAEYAASNAIDGTDKEYASQGAGPSVNLSLSLGASPQSFDRVVVVNRDSPDPNDWVSNFTLTPGGGSAVSVSRAGSQGTSNVYSMGGLVTTTSLTIQATSVAGAGSNGNTGFSEIYLLRNPINSEAIAGVSVVDASAAYSGGGNYIAAKATDGIIGRSNGSESAEYASSAGTSLFVEFDLGALKPVTGFDFFDRPAAVDRTDAFTLTFSQNAIFGDADDVVKSYTNTASAMSDEFGALNARYVRYNVTATSAGFAGMSEMIFYQTVPEPSSALLGLLLAPALLRRRR